MSETFKIRLAARCSAAGRPENEDNFQVAEDLSVSNAGFTTDKIFPLGSKGTLLLVCDGMGGMNAGEVASAIGVETIKDFFAPQMINNEVIANDNNICAYMKQSIVKADSRIKEEAQKDSAKQGMGSTAVMAWLLGQKVYVAWCGDSRCYRFNPSTGLEQLSHDHSYVQDLVDTGQLTPELAFDHPNKNIITRSLGDPRGAARPDAKVFSLHAGDVILLCSDGLNDSLRDSQIAKTIGRSLDSMAGCRDALWSDSYTAGWHDNVTIVLAQVMGESTPSATTQQAPATDPVQSPEAAPSLEPSHVRVESPSPSANSPVSNPQKTRGKAIIAIIVAVILIVVVACVLMLKNKGEEEKSSNVPKQPTAAEKTEYNELIKHLKNCDFARLHPFSEQRDSINRVWKIHYPRLVELGKKLGENDSIRVKENINASIEDAIYIEDDENNKQILRDLKIVVKN